MQYRQKVMAAFYKIEKQAPRTPQGALMAAVFERAAKDAYQVGGDIKKSEQADAVRYLRNDIVCLEAIGISSEWARDVLVQTGLPSIEMMHQQIQAERKKARLKM